MRLEHRRWKDAWKALALPEPDGLLAELIRRYSEPHRAYHTMQHIGECFQALEPAAHLAECLAEIQIALWFHDAIYDPHAGDNEERSADWAEASLSGTGAAAVTASRIRALVLATTHDAVPVDPDCRLVADVDLAILGASRARFLEHEKQIRQEYSWVPDESFRSRRAFLLKRFLQRDTIYGTSWFAERLEERARANLTDSLHELLAHGQTPPESGTRR